MMIAGHDLSPAERRKVTEAITLAEKATTGEIVVVAARASDDYIHMPIYVATAVAFALPLFAPQIARFFPWSTITVEALFIIQLVLFIVLSLLLSITRIRMAITPRRMMRLYAHRNAAAQFLAANISSTRGHTGVLIFVSLLEHYVEVIGDQAIASKLGPADWQKIINEMLPLLKAKQTAEALALGMARCGVVLAKHFPAGKKNPNELPDRFIVIE